MYFWNDVCKYLIFSIVVYVNEGQTVVLKCNISTKGIPRWQHPDGELINFGGFAIINPNFKYKDRFKLLHDGSLSINASTHADAGIYVCASGVEKYALRLLIKGIKWLYIICILPFENNRIREI